MQFPKAIVKLGIRRLVCFAQRDTSLVSEAIWTDSDKLMRLTLVTLGHEDIVPVTARPVGIVEAEDVTADAEPRQQRHDWQLRLRDLECAGDIFDRYAPKWTIEEWLESLERGSRIEGCLALSRN